MKAGKAAVAGLFLLFLLPEFAKSSPSFKQIGNTLVMSNADVVLDYNLSAGTTDFYWKNSKKISAFYSGIGFNTGYVKGVSYTSWNYALSGSNEAIITATAAALPTMKQYFILDQTNSFLIRVEADGANLSANWMGPVVVDSTIGGFVDIGITNDNRALYVPFDNDGFVTYNAMPMNSSTTSYEVAAFYDNTSRNGLVVGSVTHDKWKTGVYFYGVNNKLNQMNVFGGATSPWDRMPHGYVSGNTISSPTMFVGFSTDWRTAMLNYAAENTNFAPRMTWTNGVPFGWNSWGIIQTKINYSEAIAVSDFFHTNLEPQGFTNTQGTVYINFDAFWNNLNDFELQSFVSHCHAYGQKAGIYWTPFAWFGAATNATNTFVEGTTNAYVYSDILLRDTNGNFESVDGGLAVDPTHPGARDSIQYNLNMFTNYGFDYIKLDFLSHGALEGVHYDTNITTGIEAYNEGMSNVLSQINGRMFISESIAPLFPYQYANSRRIACDAETSQIGNTAYTMNSVTYGWWLDNLYDFNDPDIMVFNSYGASTNENQSRFINAAVTGVFLDGDDLTTSAGQQGADYCLTNSAINAVARIGQTFTPAEGNTGASAANIFSMQNSSNWYIGVFNYTVAATNITVNLNRAGVPAGNYVALDLWSKSGTLVTSSFNTTLNPAQSKLFELYAPGTGQASLQWSASGNNGVWDVDNSANWLNVSNETQTVFNQGDNVLFDDTPGVPTTVNVSGTVDPSLITVNASANAFTIQSGAFGGSGSLIKQGSSPLTITCSAGLSGSVSIQGGSVYAGNNCFNNVSSITVTNNSTLDFGGGQFNSLKPITISGTGLNGEGALYDSYNGNTPAELVNVTLAGDASFGGSTRWDLASGSQISGPHSLIVDWSHGGGYGQWNGVTIGANVPQIDVTNASSLGMQGMDTSCQNPATLFNISTNGALTLYSGGFNGSLNLYNGVQMIVYNGNVTLGGSSLHLYSGVTMYLYGAGIAMTGNNLILEDRATIQTYYNSGDNPISNQVTLNGVAHLVLGNHTESFNNIMSGAGGFVLDYYDHSVVLSASNTYSGPTIIGSSGNTPQVALSGNGSITHSSLIFFGGSDPTVGHIDASGRSDQTLTLASGQTLGGVGGITGNFVLDPGAVLLPGGTNTTIGITTGSNPTGEIAASGNVTLEGTTVIKLDGATNDVVAAGGTITYGGTLNLANISGTALAGGNSFKIFNAAVYTGTFSGITPTTPGAGLSWNTSQLSSGVISVSGSSGAVITSTSLSGTNLVFSGSGGTASAPYYVLSTTNLLTGPWITNTTGNFLSNGNFSVTNAIKYDNPNLFYMIK